MEGIRRRHILGFAFLAPIADAFGAPALAQSAKGTPSPGPRFFVKGVYQQPPEKMEGWKARGVNTIFTVNGGGDIGLWTQEANRLGLYMVREPSGLDVSGPVPSFLVADRAAFERDLREERLLAFALMDEPSNVKPGGNGITYEGVTLTPAEVDVVARDWAVGGKPLWVNHIGAHINNAYVEEIMSDYADSSYIDWLSHDCYPVATGTDMILELDDYKSTQQGHAIDRLLLWSGGKPQFSIIGLTQFNGSAGQETTPAEFRVQAWSSIIHGAAGVIYFTFKFSPEFSYDATPQALIDELNTFHSEIDKIEDILMDSTKGGRRPSLLLKAVGASDSGLPYPFEGCSVRTETGEYKIILNLSNERAELAYEPWGLSQLSFDPYQCRRGYTPAELMG